MTEFSYYEENVLLRQQLEAANTTLGVLGREVVELRSARAEKQAAHYREDADRWRRSTLELTELVEALLQRLKNINTCVDELVGEMELLLVGIELERNAS